MKARVYATQKAREMWRETGDISKAVRAYRDAIEDFAATREELRAARDARAQRYGIGVKEGGSLTPPRGYPTDANEYGDPTNYRYPAENYDRSRAAMTYFNRVGQREAGGYTSAEWAVVGRRLARLIGRHLPASYEYRDGKLKRKED